MKFMLRGALAATVAVAALSASARAEEGVTADTITFGQAAVLEGPASALGLGMQKGLTAAFDEVNAKGGVHGRKIKLISVNDGYEPDRAIAACQVSRGIGVGMVAPASSPQRRATICSPSAMTSSWVTKDISMSSWVNSGCRSARKPSSR